MNPSLHSVALRACSVRADMRAVPSALHPPWCPGASDTHIIDEGWQAIAEADGDPSQAADSLKEGNPRDRRGNGWGGNVMRWGGRKEGMQRALLCSDSSLPSHALRCVLYHSS